MIQSKLSIKSIIPISGLFGLGMAMYILLHDENISKLMFSLLLVLFLTITVYLVISILRLQMCSVKIESQLIQVTNFMGLGKTRRYLSSEILGYTTSNMPGKISSKWIYIYSNEKRRIVRISDFYFSNYPDLWKVIKANYRNLGYERFSVVNELKDPFV